MKKFTLIQEEAGERVHGGGNPFSNGHRSRDKGNGFLKNHFMLDLDEIIYDDSNNIIAIVEKKYKAESFKLGNILKGPTLQKGLLLHISKILGCKFFVNITSEEKFYRIDSLTEAKEFSKESFELSRQKYKTYQSDDMIYIEYRCFDRTYSNYSVIAVVKRLEDNINVNGILVELMNKLNVPLVKVDDLGDTIKFYQSPGPGGQYVDEVKSVLDPTKITDNDERTQLEDKWEEIYRKLGIW